MPLQMTRKWPRKLEPQSCLLFFLADIFCCLFFLILIFRLTSSVIPVVAAFMIVDGVQVVSSGVLRGCGRQKIGAISTFVAFYIVGLPTGALLCFLTDVGLMGYWIGLAVALFAACCISTTIVFRTDWREQVRLARKRILAQL